MIKSKILLLTFGSEECASTKYRLHQYKNFFRKDQILTDYQPAKTFSDFERIDEYEIVILQKAILSTQKVRKLAKLAKRFIYDVDDRIWLRPFKKHSFFSRIRINYRMQKICQSADLCMVANDLIAKDIKVFGGRPIIIPMALDGKTWFPREKTNNQIVIGWTGAPGNLPFLEEILPSIKIFVKNNPRVKLVIHCGKNPHFQDVDFEYIEFEAGKEHEVVRSFDIGLLPLPQNDPFTDGKSPIKGIQYIASGVVVVATKTISALNLLGSQINDAGFVNYAETINDWGRILSELTRNPNELTHIGKKGRDFFESNYEFGKTYKLLRSTFLNRIISCNLK